MEYDISKPYKVELNIENELGVFEPRDELAGHVLIQTDDDVEIHSCNLWLYGIAKTRWNAKMDIQLSGPGSLTGGLNLLRSTSHLNKLDLVKGYELNKICPIVTKNLFSSSTNFTSLSNSFMLSCCHENGYLSDTQYKSSYKNCLINYNSINKLENNTEDDNTSRINNNNKNKDMNWLSKPNSLISSYPNSIESLANPTLLKEKNCLNERQKIPLNSPSIDLNLNKIYGDDMRNYMSNKNSCLSSRLCHDYWKQLFDLDRANSNLHYGDIQIIYKSKLDLLKHYSKLMKSNDKSNLIKREKFPNLIIINKTNGNNNSDNGGNVEQYKERENSLVKSDIEWENKSTQTMKYTTNTTNITGTTPITKPEFKLTRGIHVFDFEFQLPADLPSSFELPSKCLAGGALASINYIVRLEIYNYNTQVKYTHNREIIIFRPLELIHFPRLRDRITLHKEFVSFGCCSTPNGLIICDLTVNKTGFVPGESIIPQVHITNHSSRAIHTVHLTFAQTVTLNGANKKTHTEVLRIFATRLNARSPMSIDESEFDNHKLTLFSSSNSFSSRGSIFRFENGHITNPDFTANDLMKLKSKSYLHKRNHSGCENKLPIMAVNGQGGKAYFTDVIHVPPLPATGLVGRQNLIYIEYSLILRLRMEGDREGRHDHCMQIPITIGSDPTRETSFIGSNEVVPCYASFDFATGDIVEYNPKSMRQMDHTSSLHLIPVYRYFKPRPVNDPQTFRTSDSNQSMKSTDYFPKKAINRLRNECPKIKQHSSSLSMKNLKPTLSDNSQIYFHCFETQSPLRHSFDSHYSDEIKSDIANSKKHTDKKIITKSQRSIPDIHAHTPASHKDTKHENMHSAINYKYHHISRNSRHHHHRYNKNYDKNNEKHMKHKSPTIHVKNYRKLIDSSLLPPKLSDRQFFDDGVTIVSTRFNASNNIFSTTTTATITVSTSCSNTNTSTTTCTTSAIPNPTDNRLNRFEKCHSSMSSKTSPKHFSPSVNLYISNNHQITNQYMDEKIRPTNIPLRQYSFEVYSDQTTSFDDQLDQEINDANNIHDDFNDLENNEELNQNLINQLDKKPLSMKSQIQQDEKLSEFNKSILDSETNSEGNLQESDQNYHNYFSQNYDISKVSSDLFYLTNEQENNKSGDSYSLKLKGNLSRFESQESPCNSCSSSSLSSSSISSSSSSSSPSSCSSSPPIDSKQNLVHLMATYLNIEEISTQESSNQIYDPKLFRNIHQAYCSHARVKPILGRQSDTNSMWTVGPSTSISSFSLLKKSKETET